MPISQNNYANTITRPLAKTHNVTTISGPSALTPDEIFNFLTHLTAMNSHSASKEDREKPRAEAIPESSPDSPAPIESSESSESSEPTSESQKSNSSSPEGDTDTDSTSMMTHSPLQAKLAQPATEHLEPEYPLITMKPY